MSTATEQILSKTNPWSHQSEAFAFCEPKRGCLLALDMGVGKSKVAVDLIVNRGHQFTLVLCPLSVVSVWPKQFALHAGREVSVLALEQGSVQEKKEKTQEFLRRCFSEKAYGAVILNYESAWRAPLAEYLLGIPLQCAVFDESHRFKSPSGKASNFAYRLAQRVPWRIALTGTPMPHSPLDIYAQYRALDPSIFGLNYHAFKQRYTVLGGWQGKQVVGWKNQEEMNERIYRIAFRVGKEVLDLPEATHEIRTCQLGAKAKKVYTDLENDFLALVDKSEVTVANALVRLLRMQQVTSGYVKTDDGGQAFLDTAKQDLLADLLEDLPLSEPIIVFCRFRHDLDIAKKTATAAGRKAFEISGQQNDLKTWHSREDTREGDVLAVQIQSGGVGIDLTRARYCIYYSLGLSLGDYLQSQARIHRPGQERPVFYYYLIAAGTVDERVYERLEKRQEVVEGILAQIKERAA